MNGFIDRNAKIVGRRISSPGVGRGLAFLVLSLMVLGPLACTDEKIVFRDRELFQQPPDTVNFFLGYFDTEEKLTACGNCHVGQQSGWEGTAHADAWAGLQSSPGAQAFCEGCHAVSQEGNTLDEPAGINLVRNEQYYDVQCENCHGPGFEHVQNPDVAERPLAPAAVGVDLGTGCGECHSDTHHPFVEEWSQSPHANVVSFAAAREECAGCHRGQTTLETWGEDADYLEKDSSDPLPVVCAVCHDPHSARHEGQLRFPVNTTSIEEHLCARCHNRRTAPDPASSHGLEPHSPESALLVGDAGWFPPGANIDQGQIRGTHGSERNERLCATCHIAAFTVTDPETGDFAFQATGHLFRPIPCIDAEGKPTPFEDGCALSLDTRSYAACTESGCHGDEQAAFSALVSAVNDIQQKADQLLSQLEQVDPNLEEAGGEIDPENPAFTVAEGAFFNYHLANFGGEAFGTNTVIGSATHNPFLVRALLIASMQAVENEYGVTPVGVRPGTDWDAELQAVIRRAGG